MSKDNIISLSPPVPDVNKIIQRRAQARKDRKTIITHFKKWVKEDHAEKFAMYEPIGAQVILRVYVYEPPEEKFEKKKLFTGFDDDGSGQSKLHSQAFPFAKILALGTNLTADYEHLQLNQVVLVPEDIISVEENPKWLEWQMVKREKPSIDDDWAMPPRWVPKIAGWARYQFNQDKFLPFDNMSEDSYTFQLPVTLVRTNVNVNLIK